MSHLFFEIVCRRIALGASAVIMNLMKTTTKSRREIVTEYAALIQAAEKTWDTEEVARLLTERNAKLER